VLGARWSRLVSPAFEDPVVDQTSQPGREHVSCDVQAGLEVVELCRAAQRIANDQEGPPFADDLERARYRAVQTAEARIAHLNVPQARIAPAKAPTQWVGHRSSTGTTGGTCQPVSGRGLRV